MQAFAHGVHRGPDHVLRPRFAELQPLAVAFDARERQEVLDQAAEALVLARNQIEVVAGLLWIELLVFEERVDQQPHGSQRRLEFVRDRSHQVGLEPGQTPLPPERPPDEDTRHGHGGDHQEARPQVGDHAAARGLIERLRIQQGERDPPARQHGTGGNRLSFVRLAGRKHRESSASRRGQLIEHSPHRRQDRPGAIQRNDSAVRRGEFPYAAQARRLELPVSRGGAFRIQELRGQELRRIGRQCGTLRCRQQRAQLVHQKQALRRWHRHASVIVHQRRQTPRRRLAAAVARLQQVESQQLLVAGDQTARGVHGARRAGGAEALLDHLDRQFPLAALRQTSNLSLGGVRRKRRIGRGIRDAGVCCGGLRQLIPVPFQRLRRKPVRTVERRLACRRARWRRISEAAAEV